MGSVLAIGVALVLSQADVRPGEPEIVPGSNVGAPEEPAPEVTAPDEAATREAEAAARQAAALRAEVERLEGRVGALEQEVDQAQATSAEAAQAAAAAQAQLQQGEAQQEEADASRARRVEGLDHALTLMRDLAAALEAGTYQIGERHDAVEAQLATVAEEADRFGSERERALIAGARQGLAGILEALERSDFQAAKMSLLTTVLQTRQAIGEAQGQPALDPAL